MPRILLSMHGAMQIRNRGIGQKRVLAWVLTPTATERHTAIRWTSPTTLRIQQSAVLQNRTQAHLLRASRTLQTTFTTHTATGRSVTAFVACVMLDAEPWSYDQPSAQRVEPPRVRTRQKVTPLQRVITSYPGE